MNLEPISQVDSFEKAVLKSTFDKRQKPPEIYQIRPSQLVINRGYQREVSRKGAVVISKIIQNFDWLRFGVITVSRMDDGKFSIIDGQHRAIAAWHLGLEYVPAVVRSLETKGQASAFLDVNIDRTTVGPIDKFRAKVASGDEFAVTLNTALEQIGIKLVTNPGYDLQPYECRSIGSLSTIAKKFGIGTMQTAMEMLIDSQPDVLNVLANFNMHLTVRAVDRVVSNGGDINRLQRILEATVFEENYEKARQLGKMLGGSNYLFGAKLLMRAYNKGLRTPLSEDFK